MCALLSGIIRERKGTTVIWFLIIGLFVLLATGMPVALAIGIPSLIYVIVDGSIPNFAAIQTMVGGGQYVSTAGNSVFYFCRKFDEYQRSDDQDLRFLE